MTSRREWSFGKHWVRLEDTELVRVTFDGPMTLADARFVIPLYAELCAGRPRYFILDISRSVLEPEARKYLAAHLEPGWFLGAVYVGASLAMRTVTRALTMMVLFKAKRGYDVAFASSDTEADAIIDRWRRSPRIAARGLG